MLYRGKNMYEDIISGDAMRDEREVPKWDRECKNKCGAHGYRWGSLSGYCTNCKHTENVGCKCILEGKKGFSRIRKVKGFTF